MQRRTVFAALAVVLGLTGCQGPENLTSPQPTHDYITPPTIVQGSHVTPSGSTNDDQYGGSHTDVPDENDDDTCEAS